MTRPLPTAALALGLLLGASPLAAGQLFIDEYPLVESMRDGPVYLGSVKALDAAKGTLTFEIRRLWIGGKEVEEGKVVRFKEVKKKGTTWTRQFDEKVKVGAVLSVRVYQGIEWTDPNESPIDRRLAGRASLREFKAGDEIIVVGTDGAEVMKPTEKVLAELAGSGKAKR